MICLATYTSLRVTTGTLVSDADSLVFVFHFIFWMTSIAAVVWGNAGVAGGADLVGIPMIERKAVLKGGR